MTAPTAAERQVTPRDAAMTTAVPGDRGRLTVLRAAWLFDGTSSAVDGDPITDAEALHRIRAVYARGTVVPCAGT